MVKSTKKNKNKQFHESSFVNDFHKNKKSLTPILLLSYLLTILIGCGQVYFLIRVISGLSLSTTMDYWISVLVAFFFFCFSIFFVGKNLITMFFAFLEGSKITAIKLDNHHREPLVTILIPCHNEEKNIVSTLESALSVDYSNLEIIIIDDGSNDKTLSIAQEYSLNVDADVKLLHQENSGKAVALNYGYSIAKGSYILSMDADSELDRNSVRRLVCRSIESNSGAVAGQVYVNNTNNMLCYLQQLEYVIMNGTARLFQSYFSSVLIAPGPITLFDKAALERTVSFNNELGNSLNHKQSGPWESSTFAEDAKLSMTMLAAGEKCVFEPSAICLTQAPSSISDLMNQRYRWIRGNLQAIRSTWNVWRHAPDKKPSLSIWLMWFIFESLVWPLVDVFGLILIVILLANTDAAAEGIIWYMFLIGSDVAAAIFAASACNGKRRLAFLVPFYRLGYGLLLQCVALFSFLDEGRGGKMKWT